MANKSFWRCNVCNDIHFGVAGPEICPTCSAKNAFVESDKEEAVEIMGL
jgi:rubrerythrin